MEWPRFGASGVWAVSLSMWMSREDRMDDRNLVIVLLLLAGIACALSYRLGHAHGVDDGWWLCAAEYGVVA